MGEKGIMTNRRTFIATTTLAATAGFLGIGRKAIAADEKKDTTANQSKPIIERVLGRTGIKIPIVGMGVMNADNPALVRRAYEIGVRHFDTAAVYQGGRNEEMVGKVINQLNVRENVIIATKIFLPEFQRNQPSSDTKSYYLKTIDESLERLKMDSVDILYSHNVSDLQWLKNEAVIDTLREIKLKKKARFIGFTTHMNMNEVINSAIEIDAYDVILTTFNYSLSNNSEYLATLKRAAAKGIGLIAMKTQCQQPWYKEGNSKGLQSYYEGEILNSALLKWVLRHDFIACAVPGYTAFTQLDEDFPVAKDLQYTANEKKFLEDRNVILGMNSVCTQCKKCVSTCPRNADVPNILRAHMYMASYGNFHQARYTLDSIQKDRSLSACKSCTTCTARCSRDVNISRRIDEIKTLYA